MVKRMIICAALALGFSATAVADDHDLVAGGTSAEQASQKMLVLGAQADEAAKAFVAMGEALKNAGWEVWPVEDIHSVDLGTAPAELSELVRALERAHWFGDPGGDKAPAPYELVTPHQLIQELSRSSVKPAASFLTMRNGDMMAINVAKPEPWRSRRL